MNDQDAIERTICQLPSCHVFAIPTLKNAGGHRAADWPKDPTWSGKLKIVAKGRDATVFLLDQQNNVFARCPVTEGAVEKVSDSGRYFVLKIVNDKGRHAFIGMAFNERNDAFDFNVALQEHKNECDREDQAAHAVNDAPTGPMKDMSLKEGEKIKVKIGFTSKRDKSSTSSHSSSSSGGSSLPLPFPSAPSSSTSSLSHHSSHPPNAIQSFDVFSSSTTHPASAFSFDSSGFGSDPFGGVPSSTSSASSAAPSGFGSGSDPFFGGSSSSSSSAFASAPAQDPFGFPVSSSFTSSTPANSNSGSVNLLDF